MSKYYIDTITIEYISKVLQEYSYKLNAVQSIPLKLQASFQASQQSGYNLSEIKNRLYIASKDINKIYNDLSILSNGLSYVSSMSEEADSLALQIISSSTNNPNLDAISKILDIVKAFFEVNSKTSKNNNSNSSAKYGLSSSAISYIKSLITFFRNDCNSASDWTCNVFDLVKSSSSMYKAVYTYYDKTLEPLEASKLGEAYWDEVGIISIVGNVFGFSGDLISTYEKFQDKDSTLHDKLYDILNTTDSGIDVSKTIVKWKYGAKSLTILDDGKYAWKVADKSASKLKNTTGYLALASTIINTFGGGVREYGKVTEDGHLSFDDMGKIGFAASTQGLTSIISFFTGGLSDVFGLSNYVESKTDDIYEAVQAFGREYLNNHEFSMEYAQKAQLFVDSANDENNSMLLRIANTVIAGTGMVGAIIIDSTADLISFISKH